ncbi:hypothetical protein GOODEAATRI_023021, partial [Goodea atripinnis]
YKSKSMIEFFVFMLHVPYLAKCLSFTGWEEFEKEGGRQRASVCVKEEQQEEISEPRTENVKTKAGCQQNNDGVLLQKSLSKLSEVLEAATMDRDSNINLQKIHPTEGSVTEPFQSYFTPQTDKTSVSSMLSAAQLENNCLTCSPPSILPYDQPSSILGEKNSEWFSLLPRSPCDGSYVISNTSRPAFCSSSPLVRTKPSLFLFSNTQKKNTKAGNNRLQSAVSEEAEGNRDEDLCLADCNSVNKSETTEPLSNKPTCASFPAQEVAKTQDFICPQPVPEGKSETFLGWMPCKPQSEGEDLVCFEHKPSSSVSVENKKLREMQQENLPDFLMQRSNNRLDIAIILILSPSRNKEEVATGMRQVLLADLEAHQDAWPFLSPVRHKSVPGYRKVIKKPMDFSTIKEKLTNNLYLNLENFIVDVNLVFDNCQRFNEDDSEIGRAGHRMRRFFDKRWTELLHF